ncbi:MAG: hypothetical protein AAFW81_11235 [Pseudomonadota bacterium]
MTGGSDAGPGFSIAKTHLRLFIQAREAGYSKADILTLRRDYQLSTQLNGGCFRKNGAPLLTHLVGAASVLITEGQPMALVRAMLNHTTYRIGRFPTGARGFRADHQQFVIAQLGPEIEALVRNYETFAYSPELAAQWVSSRRKFEGRDKDLLVMRLCNEADDSADYSPALELRKHWADPAHIENLKVLCSQVGLTRLPSAFDFVLAQMADADWLSPETELGHDMNAPSISRYAKAVIMRGISRLR